MSSFGSISQINSTWRNLNTIACLICLADALKKWAEDTWELQSDETDHVLKVREGSRKTYWPKLKNKDIVLKKSGSWTFLLTIGNNFPKIEEKKSSKKNLSLNLAERPHLNFQISIITFLPLKDCYLGWRQKKALIKSLWSSTTEGFPHKCTVISHNLIYA